MERRTFLQRLAAIPIFGVAVGRDASDYQDSTKVLEELAEEIDQTDLTDGGEVFHLWDSVRRAVELAEQGIGTSETNRARTVESIKHSVAQRLAIIPGIDPPPEQPRIETEINAIESAVSYYNTVETYLQHSGDLYSDITNFEADVSDPTGQPSLTDDDLMKRVDDAIVNMKTESEPLQSDDEPLLQSLLPDITRVAAQSEELFRMYEVYVSAQRNYYETTEDIAEGAQMREQENFDEAETYFADALGQPSIDFSESTQDYSLDDSSLTVSEYETVISLTQQGVQKMQDSCDTPDTDQSRELFSQGLQDVIDARSVFIQQ